ncbi:hydroxyproline O-galactosyltransferase HPGT1-like [Coffea eugenioides]|uniref:hydroxyproline O-galactosyltransferase HPGT1-like n=1 Tax=Coffea eugenioides TaxID=49369 RepID=UPI000F60D4F4|nr:hydroxyproline O-galactosyltransferase HPGT1-like [Coffea eugenioides]
MQTKVSNANRHSGIVIRSRTSTMMLSMFATLASFKLPAEANLDISVSYEQQKMTEYEWIDEEERVLLTKELDRITGQGHSAISVDDTLKIIACREQKKKLSALEMELVAARQEGFVSSHLPEKNSISNKRPLVVIGILTGFSHKSKRDAVRKAWMGTGKVLKKVEDEKGIIARFVIGRSSNRSDSLDRSIDNENKETNDFLILENHVDAPEEHPNKTKSFFAYAAENWDADFFAKINDDVFLNIGNY